MNNWVGENVNNLSKDFFNKFISLLKSNIQRTHVPMSKSTSYVFILRSFSPTCCMTWCVKFRDDSYTSYHGVSNKLSGICCCVCFLWTERGMLCNFRMWIQNKWEGVFISDVPVEDTQFVVHHSIDSFIK